jgi:nucleotide-binding universal stress UspA family protein
MNQILLTFDQLYSEDVFSIAQKISNSTSSLITLLSVASQKYSTPIAKDALVNARERFNGERVKEIFRVGNPVDILLEELERSEYDLVVISAGKRPSLQEKVFNRSFHQKIIDKSPVPVFVARKPAIDWERILICTGGREESEQVIEISANLAGILGSKATLLYVGSAVPSMYTGLNGMEETIDNLLATDTPLAQHLRRGAEILSNYNVEGEIEIHRGLVADGIIREAVKANIDLIVLGVSGVKKDLKGWLLGNITIQVVERAPCSVLIVC